MVTRQPRRPDDGWTESDAWVLSAIRMSGSTQSPARLIDVVAACDALHRLIPSLTELSHALGLLVGCGLVTVDERGLAVTALGRELVAGARGPDAARRNRALLSRLTALPRVVQPLEVDAQAYEAACLEYQNLLWRELRRGGRT